MRDTFGTIALSLGLASLWDEFLGLIFTEILDLDSWGIPMPEWAQNIGGVFLIGVAVVAFNWQRITAWRKKLPHHDAVTNSGRKVFVSRSIDLSGIANHELAETVFVDCELYGDCAIYLETTVFLADSFNIKPNNRFNNAIYLVPDETALQKVLVLRNCTLLKCRINTTYVVITDGLRRIYDPDRISQYRAPPAEYLVNGAIEIEIPAPDNGPENVIQQRPLPIATEGDAPVSA